MLIIDLWTPSKAFDQSSPKDVDSSFRIIQMILFLKSNIYTFSQVLRELVLVSKSHIILSVTRSLIHLESKQTCKAHFLARKSVTVFMKNIILYRWISFIEDGSTKHGNPLKIGWKTQRGNKKQIWKKFFSCLLKCCQPDNWCHSIPEST